MRYSTLVPFSPPKADDDETGQEAQHNNDGKFGLVRTGEANRPHPFLVVLCAVAHARPRIESAALMVSRPRPAPPRAPTPTPIQNPVRGFAEMNRRKPPHLVSNCVFSSAARSFSSCASMLVSYQKMKFASVGASPRTWISVSAPTAQSAGITRTS